MSELKAIAGLKEKLAATKGRPRLLLLVRDEDHGPEILVQ